MATTRRKPATRSRKASAKQSAKRSPLGFLIFGLILGLALAAFLSFYLRSSPLPFTQQTAQNSPQLSSSTHQSQQAPLQAPTRNVETPAVVQTMPDSQQAQAPSRSIAAQTATAQHPNVATDPIGAMIDPNSGLVTVPTTRSSARINPDALIRPKADTPKNPSATNSSNTGTSQTSQGTSTSSTAAATPNAKPKTTAASSDQIAQLIKDIPEEWKTPTISQNLASAPLRIQAPSSVAATDKGVHLNNTPANARQPATSTTQAGSSSASRANSHTAAKKISTQYLQVGSFANYQEADATRARMLLLGFNNVSISKTRVNNTEFNRVRIGPFNDEHALKTSQQKLQSANIPATVVR